MMLPDKEAYQVHRPMWINTSQHMLCSLCRSSLLLLLPPDLKMTYAFRDSWNDCNNHIRTHAKRSKAAGA